MASWITTTPGHGPLPGGALSSPSINPSGVSISIVVIASSNCSREVGHQGNLRLRPQTLASYGAASVAHLRRRRARGDTRAVGDDRVGLDPARAVGRRSCWAWWYVAPMAGWQLSAKIVQLRSGLKEPRSALSDSAMVSLATAPGSDARAGQHGLSGSCCWCRRFGPSARPALAAIALRGFQRRIPLITDVSDSRPRPPRTTGTAP